MCKFYSNIPHKKEKSEKELKKEKDNKKQDEKDGLNIKIEKDEKRKAEKDGQEKRNSQNDEKDGQEKRNSQNDEKDVFYSIAEQVSHHPPISAYLEFYYFILFYFYFLFFFYLAKEVKTRKIKKGKDVFYSIANRFRTPSYLRVSRILFYFIFIFPFSK